MRETKDRAILLQLRAPEPGLRPAVPWERGFEGSRPDARFQGKPVRLLRIVSALAAILLVASPALAQEAPASEAISDEANVVVPQVRAFHRDRARAIDVERVDAFARIVGKSAQTKLVVTVANKGSRPEEAVVVLPVPRGAVVSSFALGDGKGPVGARLLKADEARRIYDSIVAKMRDPALLEFAGRDMIRSSVFPVPPGGRQRVEITYDEVLAGELGRTDYVLPRSELLASSRVAWKIHVEITELDHFGQRVYFSPTHEVDSRRTQSGRAIEVSEESAKAPGSFVLSMVDPGEKGASASLFTYPDARIGGGYFLLVAGFDPLPKVEKRKRELTIVLDKSGSMIGEKMRQARAATLRLVESLEEGERFNIIDFSTGVSRFAAAPVVRDARSLEDAKQYIATLRALGGTNTSEALRAALSQPVTPGLSPIVVFITDGLPTVGELSEEKIRKIVETENKGERKIFTLGVGSDLNAPLLDRIAETTRAASGFIAEGEPIDRRVEQLVRRLGAPLLEDPQVVALDGTNEPSTRAIYDVLPERLPDLYEGDQLVVLGKYRDASVFERYGFIHFEVSGIRGGAERAKFHFALQVASSKGNAFVPRLWGSRRVAYLIDEVRQMGATAASALTDPRLRELSQEIVTLSTEFGILTEYTSFLATEGTDFSKKDQNRDSCARELTRNAQQDRSGDHGVSQATNIDDQKKRTAGYVNKWRDGKGQTVEKTEVQHVCDRAFFRRGNAWVDSRVLDRNAVPEKVVFGTDAYNTLAHELVAEGQGALLAQGGEIQLERNGKTVVVSDR